MSSLSQSLSLVGAMALIASVPVARGAEVPTVFDAHAVNNTVERTITFDPTGTGEQLPACWGLDTAWNHNDNFVRGMRAMTPDVVDIVRVSFNPYALVTTPGKVPEGECANQLKSRMEKVKKVESLRTGNKKVDIAINLDAARADLQKDYYYINSDGSYDLNKGTKNHGEWAKLLHAYVNTIQNEYGNTVVSVAPFNEPDYYWNSLRQPHFKAINEALRANYQDLQNVRISGGNTLNCDEANGWYDYLKPELDEGNTHQLAGDFDHYASFFQKVRSEGKYATGDELHNVMEAMVGIEYGLQTGIWWGEAARVRGQFCQASNLGSRLGYAENRYAWSAASVYKRSDKLSQAFVGVSERQGRPSSYSFVSRTKDVYVDGVGPTREFVLDIPADANGQYQGAGQRNAEAVYDITWGDDVMPEINGKYYIVSKANGRVVQRQTSSSSTLSLAAMKSTNERQKWNISKVRIDNGGDYSYFVIADANKPDGGWNLESWGLSEEYDPTDKYFTVSIIYSDIRRSNNDGPTEFVADNCLWHLQYAGNGWFRIRSKVSDYCIRPKKSSGGSVSTSASMVQAPFDADDDTQLFRLIPVDNAPEKFETEAPEAPQGLTVTPSNGSLTVSWNAVNDGELASYALLRADASGEFNTIARNITGTKIVDNTALYGINYAYKVVAYDKSGNRSNPSEAVSGQIGGLACDWCLLSFDDTLDDNSGNSFHARSSSNATYAQGHKNSCFKPDYGSTVMLPVGAAPRGHRFSVAAWVKVGNGNGQYLFDFGTDENNHVGLALVNDGQMCVQAVSDFGSAELKALAPSAGSWHHVAVVFDIHKWTLYLDGQEVNKLEQNNVHDCIPYEDKVLNYVGRSMRQYSYRGTVKDGGKVDIPVADGIDEFHIYNYPLTADQVKLDMNGVTLGVDDIHAAADVDVVDREYYNLKGMRIGEPAQGETVVVRTHYSNGSVVTSKEVVKP